MIRSRWFDEILAEKSRRAMPVLTFPATQLLGITVRELIASSDAQANGMAAIARRCPAAAALSMMDLSVEAECFGAKIRVSDSEVPTVEHAVLSDPADTAGLRVPAVGEGRTGVYIEAVAKARALINDRPVFAGVIGPFSLAGRLMDMTEIMVDCYDEPEAVHTVLDKATAFLTDYILAFRRAGANGVVMAEPAAGLLSPALCGAFSSAYIRRITDAVQREDFPVIYHNCGPNVGRMTTELLQTGAAAYHFGNAANMSEMLEKMPPDVPVMGNVDPVSAFRRGTPAFVREETLRILHACGGHDNFLISSGCDIPPASPWENIDAFFAAVDEYYGR